MSDTPQIYSCGRSLKAMVLFSAKLERKLNEATSEIDEKRKDVVWLATEKAKLEEHIKRLEEAGNDLHDGWRGNRNNKDKYFEAWRKAKEVK